LDAQRDVTIRRGNWLFWSVELFGALIVACLLTIDLTHYPHTQGTTVMKRTLN
jgi:hypothetical protein